jgi:hypothetical protein
MQIASSKTPQFEMASNVALASRSVAPTLVLLLPLNICAMWWDNAGGIECAYMANLARQLGAALSGSKLGAPIAAEAR